MLCRGEMGTRFQHFFFYQTLEKDKTSTDFMENSYNGFKCLLLKMYVYFTLVRDSAPLRVWKVILSLSYPLTHSRGNGCSVITVEWWKST